MLMMGNGHNGDEYTFLDSPIIHNKKVVNTFLCQWTQH